MKSWRSLLEHRVLGLDGIILGDGQDRLVLCGYGRPWLSRVQNGRTAANVNGLFEPVCPDQERPGDGISTLRTSRL